MSGRRSIAAMPGSGSDYIDVRPLREHIGRLCRAGGNITQIARLSGLSKGTVSDIMVLRPTKSIPVPRTRIRRTTAAAIFAVSPEVLRGDKPPVTAIAVHRAILTPVQPVRDHIAMLKRSGMTQGRIAELSGLPAQYIQHIMTTEPTAKHPQPFDTVTKVTASTILALAPEDGPAAHGIIDSAPTLRRLQAMLAIGYTLSMVGDMLGCSPQSVAQRLKKTNTNVDFAERVKNVYVRHAFQKPAYASGQAAAHGKLGMARAQARGWLGPLEWEDIDAGVSADDAIDEALKDQFSKEIDEVALAPILLGEHSTTLTRAEQWEAVRRLRDKGVGINETARRIGMSDRQVQRRVNELRAEEDAIANSERWGDEVVAA